MSSYVNIAFSEYQFMRIVDGLEEYVTSLTDFPDIHEYVHMIDYLHDEYDKDKAKQNEEISNWMKQQSLLVEGKKPNPQLFRKIKEVFKKHNIEFEYDDEFYCICDIIDEVEKND